jgi:hypothetical protein
MIRVLLHQLKGAVHRFRVENRPWPGAAGVTEPEAAAIQGSIPRT